MGALQSLPARTLALTCPTESHGQMRRSLSIRRRHQSGTLIMLVSPWRQGCCEAPSVSRGGRLSRTAAFRIRSGAGGAFKSLGPVVSRQFRGCAGSLCAAGPHRNCVLATGASAAPHCEAGVIILWLSLQTAAVRRHLLCTRTVLSWQPCCKLPCYLCAQPVRSRFHGTPRSHGPPFDEHCQARMCSSMRQLLTASCRNFASTIAAESMAPILLTLPLRLLPWCLKVIGFQHPPSHWSSPKWSSQPPATSGRPAA